MDVSLATFLVASFLFSALKREEIELSQFVVQQRERKKEGIPRSSANRPSEEEETYFSCRDNARSNASFVVVVAFFFSVSLLLPSVSTKSFPEEDIFNCGERKRLKEKDEKKRQAKKKVPDRLTDEKKRRGRFLGLLVVLSKSKSSKRALTVVAFLYRFFSSFCASSFFFLLGVFIRCTSRWSRARVYISRNARSRRVSRETRREKEREGKKT